MKGEEKAAAAFILCDTCRERNIREEVDPEMGPYGLQFCPNMLENYSKLCPGLDLVPFW